MDDTRRILFNNELKKIVPAVYFQPGDNVTLKYPCIVYNRTRPNVLRANRHVYNITEGFNVTYMSSSSVDSKLSDFLYAFEHCAYNNSYTSNGIYHEIFTIFY